MARDDIPGVRGVPGGPGGHQGTVPQEGHNFATSGFDFFHFFSLLEVIISMFWGEIGFVTQFTRIHSDFKKKVSKNMGEIKYFSKCLKNVNFCF